MRPTRGWSDFRDSPLQIFQTANGQTVIRIGRNTLWFTSEGDFDGTEAKPVPGATQLEQMNLVEAFKSQEDNRGKAPAEAYFEKGSNGYEAEVASWATHPDLH